MKYATRVTLVLLAVAALPTTVLHWRAYQTDRDAMAEAADRVLAGNAEEAAALLDAARRRWLDAVRADARLPGMDAVITRRNPFHDSLGSGFFTAIAGRDPVNVGAVGLLDLDGQVLLDSRALNLGRDESREPYVQQALAFGQPVLYGPYTPAGQKAPGLFAVALVRNAEETPVGLLRVRYEPSVLGQVMGAGLNNVEAISASLLDAEGRLLWGLGASGERPLPLPETAGRTTRLLNMGTERVAVAGVPGADWRVAVRQPLAAWHAPQLAAKRSWMQQSAVLLVLLVVASLLLGRRIAAPLAAFSRAARRMAEGDFQPVARWSGADEARTLGMALDQLATRLRETLGALSAELEQHRATERALRESRAEFRALVEQLPGAVYRCGNEPGWPMDYLSPQVEAITGYRSEELLADDAQGYTRLMFEEDRAEVDRLVGTALRESGHFELRYRLRHRDGSVRWIWELGAVRLDEAGQPSQLTGLLFDITDKETASQAMDLLRGGVETQLGGDYFKALATGLVRVLDVDYAMIGRFLDWPPTRAAALALVDRNGEARELEFELAGTPSREVLAAGHLEVLEGASERFPADAVLVEMGLQGYIGRRLDDRRGRPIGIITLLNTRPLAGSSAAARLLDLFQARAAAELERLMAEEELQRLAETLENRVVERTRELQAANASLSQAMDQLVQREKLASLGSLVAGLAHELNTPIGNALTVSTALGDIHRQFGELLASGQLKRSALEQFLTENTEATTLIERNLERAATLITHFKQVAVDQASMRRRRFDLSELVMDVLSTLSPRLKRSPHVVDIQVPPDICLDSYPGPLEQVLTNLVENSLVHAFPDGRVGHMRIEACFDEASDQAVLVYEDDGIGIPPESRQKVFDPFFTTRLGQGGSGLGLYLVYNLVHGRLGGRIRLLDREGGGVRFQIELPAKAPDESTEHVR